MMIGYDSQSETEMDLIRYEWTYSGIGLQVVETAHLFLLDMPLGSLQKGEEWKRLVAELVRLTGEVTTVNGKSVDYSIELRPPKEWNPGDVYSTRSRDGKLKNWTEGIDVVCSERNIRLIFEKIFTKGSHGDASLWFEQAVSTKFSDRLDELFPERAELRKKHAEMDAAVERKLEADRRRKEAWAEEIKRLREIKPARENTGEARN